MVFYKIQRDLKNKMKILRLLKNNREKIISKKFKVLLKLHK